MIQSESERLGEPPSLQIDGLVATIRLRRPAQANRLEAGDIEVLREYFRTLGEKREVRAVILTGTGKHFSAGYDIGSVLTTLEAGRAEGSNGNAFATMVDALEDLPQTTFCALNGGVFGGSTDLALACDFRVGVLDTRMFMPAARLGLHYYPSGIRRFVSRLGLSAAKRLFLFAEELDSAQMMQIGYLDAIVSTEPLMDYVHSRARLAIANAPLATAGMKFALNQIAHGAWDADTVARNELRCLASSDLREGVAAWHEKRAALFEGR